MSRALPWTISIPTSVMIAQAVFLLERGHGLCDTLSTFGFVNDVTFSHNKITLWRVMCIPKVAIEYVRHNREDHNQILLNNELRTGGEVCYLQMPCWLWFMTSTGWPSWSEVWSQLIILFLVTFGRIGKIQWFLAHVNYRPTYNKKCCNANFKQILTLNTLDGATYDQHDCRVQTTWKKIIC